MGELGVGLAMAMVGRTTPGASSSSWWAGESASLLIMVGASWPADVGDASMGDAADQSDASMGSGATRGSSRADSPLTEGLPGATEAS